MLFTGTLHAMQPDDVASKSIHEPLSQVSSLQTLCCDTITKRVTSFVYQKKDDQASTYVQKKSLFVR